MVRVNREQTFQLISMAGIQSIAILTGSQSF